MAFIYIIIIAQIIFVIVKLAMRENTTETHITPDYTSERKTNFYTGGGRPGQTTNQNVPPKKNKVPLFMPEEVFDVAAIPDGTELTSKEQVIVKMISNRTVTVQEIFNKIPRSANIQEYKEAFNHLEEMGTIKRNEDGRYAIVLSETFLQQKAANEKLLEDLNEKKLEKEEKARQEREAEIRKNAVYFKEEDLTPQEKSIISMLTKKSLKAQDILRVIPRDEDMTPYKDAINHLKEIGAITANPDGTLSYNQTFFLLSGSEKAPVSVEKAEIPEIKEETKPEETKPVEEIKAEEPAKEDKVETVVPTEEIKVETAVPIDEIKVETVEPVEETKAEEQKEISKTNNFGINSLGLVSEKAEITEVKEETKTEETKPVEEIKVEAALPVEETKVETPAETKVETTAPEEEKKTEAPAPAKERKAYKNISLDDISEEDIERLSKSADNIVKMFKETFSSGFGLDIEKALMFSAGMAGYACHQAVKANKESYSEVTTSDNKKFYMGDAVNKYLLEGKYNVLKFCDGFYEHSGLVMMKPDPMEIDKKETKAIGNKGYRIWDKLEPANVYKEVKSCWEGIYSNMTEAYCESPSEWPVLYGIVLQNIMIEAAKVTTSSRVYNMALECAFYISKMDDDSI